MVADTHRIAQRLREGGAFSEEQADAVVEAVSEFVEPIATKRDLDLLRAELREEIARANGNQVKWVAGFGALILAAQLATVIAVLAQS